MVRTSEYELKAFNRHVDRPEEGSDDIFVVFGAEVDQLNRRFEVVEEAMNVCKEDLDLTASAEEVRELQYWDEISTVRSPCRCSACSRSSVAMPPKSESTITPVNRERSILPQNNILQYIRL